MRPVGAGLLGRTDAAPTDAAPTEARPEPEPEPDPYRGS
jgi:hypothetical protein